MNIPRSQITGLVLAGGRGSRMGGVDKGLQLLNGVPLVQHALQRLAPQVGPLLLNANRHFDAYAAFGHGVVSDADSASYAGPLAGLLAALQACTTPWLASVPCDTPGFPTDLVARLADAIVQDAAPLAMACTRAADGRIQPQPVFCLMQAGLRVSLAAFVQEGRHKVEDWAMQQGCVQVVFDDEAAFFNANTLQDLESLRR